MQSTAYPKSHSKFTKYLDMHYLYLLSVFFHPSLEKQIIWLDKISQCKTSKRENKINCIIICFWKNQIKNIESGSRQLFFKYIKRFSQNDINMVFFSFFFCVWKSWRIQMSNIQVNKPTICVKLIVFLSVSSSSYVIHNVNKIQFRCCANLKPECFYKSLFFGCTLICFDWVLLSFLRKINI